MDVGGALIRLGVAGCAVTAGIASWQAAGRTAVSAAKIAQAEYFFDPAARRGTVSDGRPAKMIPPPVLKPRRIFKIAPQGDPKIVAQMATYSGLMFELCRLNSNRRRAHALGQFAHETAGFRKLLEPQTSGCQRYDGGCNYRGRGIIQITHRSNYRKYGKLIGDPNLSARPWRAKNMDTAIRIACAYWNENRLNVLADKNNVDKISRIINGKKITNKSRKNRRIYVNRAKNAFAKYRLPESRIASAE